jgi:4-hydroxybenzoate polyprenyltransferase
VFGPYLLGCVAVIGRQIDSVDWLLVIYALFFTFPANLLIYGVNDIFDYQTDKDNPKKQGYEALVQPAEHRPLSLAIVLFVTPFLLLLPLVSFTASLAMFGFLFFSIFYSAKPIRAKAKPFVDALFNILYVFPGLFGFYVTGGTQISWSAVLAGCLWCMAMHAYSAVPDIRSDQASGIRTIATHLGASKTLLVCGALYMLAGVFASSAGLGALAVVCAGVYVFLMSISFRTPADELHSVYRYFPLVNTSVGFLLFVAMLV